MWNDAGMRLCEFTLLLYHPYLVCILFGIPSLVWTPDPSGRERKGLGNNLARKCLAGMPRFLNPANFIFRSSTWLVRYYSNFQNFYALPYIHFLSLVELESWLAEMCSFPHQHRRQHSSVQDTSGQDYSPDPSSRGQKGLGSRLCHPYILLHFECFFEVFIYIYIYMYILYLCLGGIYKVDCP